MTNQHDIIDASIQYTDEDVSYTSAVFLSEKFQIEPPEQGTAKLITDRNLFCKMAADLYMKKNAHRFDSPADVVPTVMQSIRIAVAEPR